jgi:hypothetical protein
LIPGVPHRFTPGFYPLAPSALQTAANVKLATYGVKTVGYVLSAVRGSFRPK